MRIFWSALVISLVGLIAQAASPFSPRIIRMMTAAPPGSLSPTLMGTSVADASDSAVPAGYTKVFSDEFDGDRLDTTKWWTRTLHNGGTLDHYNDEAQRYRENGNHPVGGGILKLVANPPNAAHPNHWESGMIRAKTKFGKYGYYETRVKMPRGLGVWPAFWLSPEDQKWGGEIDMFEFVNNGTPADNINTIHTGAVATPTAQNTWPGPQKLRYLETHPSYNSRWTYWTAPFNFPDAYHVIGCLWDTDDTVTIWIDGVMIVKYQYLWVHQNGADAGWASLMLNLVIGGSKWAGKNGVDTSEPQILEVDYVRVYQRSDKVQTAISNVGRDFCPANGGC
jgi:beta-glucanase (GH16 family)